MPLCQDATVIADTPEWRAIATALGEALCEIFPDAAVKLTLTPSSRTADVVLTTANGRHMLLSPKDHLHIIDALDRILDARTEAGPPPREDGDFVRFRSRPGPASAHARLSAASMARDFGLDMDHVRARLRAARAVIAAGD